MCHTHVEKTYEYLCTNSCLVHCSLSLWSMSVVVAVRVNHLSKVCTPGGGPTGGHSVKSLTIHVSTRHIYYSIVLMWRVALCTYMMVAWSSPSAVTCKHLQHSSNIMVTTAEGTLWRSSGRLSSPSSPQVFGTPRNHPKSKPFIDHVFHFAIADHKVWFRNYHVSVGCGGEVWCGVCVCV